jgi:hypothetical protein
LDPALASVIVGLVGVGGLGGLYKSLFGGKNDEKITDKEADEGLIDPAYAFIVEQVAEIRADLDEERDSHRETKEKVEALAAKNAAYEKNILRLQWSLHSFIAWAHDLELNWEFHRAREDPPTPPDIQAD